MVLIIGNIKFMLIFFMYLSTFYTIYKNVLNIICHLIKKLHLINVIKTLLNVNYLYRVKKSLPANHFFCI